jgi:hypothetical protein
MITQTADWGGMKTSKRVFSTLKFTSHKCTTSRWKTPFNYLAMRRTKCVWKLLRLIYHQKELIRTSILSSLKNRNISADIADGCGLDGRGTGGRFPGGVRDFLFSTAFRWALGFAHPPIQWIPGALSPGLKRQRREADHSIQRRRKEWWSYTSTPPDIFMMWCLIN